MIGSVKSGRPVSQHREFVGGPDVAEQGDALRAPGGTVVVVTAMATGAVTGGEGGVVETVLCVERKSERKGRKKNCQSHSCIAIK